MVDGSVLLHADTESCPDTPWYEERLEVKSLWKVEKWRLFNVKSEKCFFKRNLTNRWNVCVFTFFNEAPSNTVFMQIVLYLDEFVYTVLEMIVLLNKIGDLVLKASNVIIWTGLLRGSLYVKLHVKNVAVDLWNLLLISSWGYQYSHNTPHRTIQLPF